MRILLVEDSELIGDGLVDALEFEGDRVDWLKDGEAALHAALTESFDVMILDLGLPKMDGLEVLRRIRDKEVAIPVIILTARDQITQRVKGLDSGADDYMVKPFDVDELLARLRAIKRRYHRRMSPQISVGKLLIHPEERQVWFAGRQIKLSRREYDLLFELASHLGKVLTKQKLTELLYGWDQEVESNAVEVHVHNLRKKLSTDLIATIRGVGYCMRP